MYFVSCPKQGLETEAVVLHRVGFLEYFLIKTGSGFQTIGGIHIPKHPQFVGMAQVISLIDAPSM